MKVPRRKVLWFALLSPVALVLAVILRPEHRSEFSPATLECRGVSAYSLPLTRVVVWTSTGEPYREEIAQFWLDEGYARAEGMPPGPWHLISSWVPGQYPFGRGPAKTFWHWSGCSGDAGGEWVAWSRRHPALAADLWPRVVGLIRRAGTEQLPDRCYMEAALLMINVRGVGDEPAYRKGVSKWERLCAQLRERE